jgi:hypothetical protein
VTDTSVLLSDPVFQLNALLWAVENLPTSATIHPVLRAAGYYLSAIGRRVIVPVDLKSIAALEQITQSKDQSPSHPDLWLKHHSHEVQPLVELKAHGFSSTSSNSRQAVKLLLSAANLGPSLATRGPLPGHVIYATAGDDADALAQTLHQLSTVIKQAGAQAAPASTIGFTWATDGVTLTSPRPEELPQPLRSHFRTPALLLEVGELADDIRPLYLIPWVPEVAETQDPQLRADRLHELTARLLLYTIGTVGRASTPTSLSVTGTQLLDEATFGVFARWRDADRSQFASDAARLVERTLRATGFVQVEGERIEIDLPTAQAQQAIIERLEHADPADPSKNLQAVIEEPPTLFDSIAGTFTAHDVAPPEEP